MQIAQRLYQGIDFEGDTVGLITYMRTDGTNISQDAIKECRNYIDKEIGKKYLPSEARNYSGKKAKNAQEAHEAIRPTDILRTPEKMRSILDITVIFLIFFCQTKSAQNPAWDMQEREF